ncbi:acetate--CoA ligase family protein [Oricola sp.]|uniref:acetate--CoA ligase family protein n=1 Tax=Oricola sp. TaxID=1979950 RepID=UPI003BAB93A1
MHDLSRLLRPKSIALFGGGWAVNVAEQLRKSGYDGDIWPVNPKRSDIGGIPCLPSIDALPAAPDASFIGVNREATIDVVRALRDMGAGGATCFASGYLESETEHAGGADLQAKLVEAAGSMPIFGPNCYGMLNYLDSVALWPDQHGGTRVERGVAIVAQSSNIAINMTMQARGLPIAYVVAAGNQAQTSIADIATDLLEDHRVTAIGLYLEGFGDIRELEQFARKARDAGKPVVVLKVGRTEKARAGTMTHTASLAGSGAASSALIERLGFIEVRTIAVFLETLKLLDMFGPLPGNTVCSVSCSGGEAALMADMAEGKPIDYRDFSNICQSELKGLLGPDVSVANPLDYHTYIWGDTERMTDVFASVMRDRFDLVVCLLDMPRPDRCETESYHCAVDAIIAARQQTGARVAVLACLPENLTEAFSQRFIAAGIVPLHGMADAMAAIGASIARPDAVLPLGEPVLLSPACTQTGETLSEAQSKAALAAYGLPMPASVTAEDAEGIAVAATSLAFPAVLKGLGVAHKSEAGAVVLNLADAGAMRTAASAMADFADGFLAEEMIADTIAEIIVGITRDATGMLMLTVGSGGVLTELLADTAHLLLPASRQDIRAVLGSLRIAPILHGYRGKPAADIEAIVDAIMAICSYAEDNGDRLLELDVNPLIARPAGAAAVDALIHLQREEPQ